MPWFFHGVILCGPSPSHEDGPWLPSSEVAGAVLGGGIADLGKEVRYGK